MRMKNGAGTENIRPFPWKCAECGKREVYPVEEDYPAAFLHDGRTYRFTVSGLRVFRCRKCGAGVLDTAASERISRAFRREARLLAPEEIREQRKALGLTQEQLAVRLGVAQETLSRWETGAQIQQRSLDNLLRLFFTLPAVREALPG
jgi:putative zinc finger/helix-turn-helix YgiT family protein